MARLELTDRQVAILEGLLRDATRADEEAQGDRLEEFRALLAAVVEARSKTGETATCIVCGQNFTQSKTGRRAKYCSPKCKQKRYRQEQLDQLRSRMLRGTKYAR